MNPFLSSKNLLFKCLVLLLLAGFGAVPASAQVKFGNSYVNLTKKTIGGTVQPGDILEIRTNIYFSNGWNSNILYYARYVDNVPVKTIFNDDSLRLITNEGLTYKKWTLAADTDPGTYNASPSSGQYNIKINLGRNATAPSSTSNNAGGAGNINTGGSLKDKPRANGNVLITTSFKVKVTGNLGDTIILGAGQIRYKTSNNINAADVAVSAIQYKILISNNDPICTDAIGKNFVDEAGGTFDSSNTQNRATGPSFPIPGYVYMNNVSSTPAITDGSYAIVNNLSPWASTFVNAERKNSCPTPTGGSPPASAACSNRMFGGYWDIIGDHTGSSTPAGNSPKAVGTRGGYMLVVNADYATSEAYRQSISGLCASTSYEFSLWVRNICKVCGADSSSTSTYKPGVYPNLSFAIDGLDRYSSGEIDTVGWVKKGFLFKTGPTQSTVTISIRNNASGGGGNDWAIDDIALVTCNPYLNMVPSGNSQVCLGSQLDINTTVSAFFKNYNYYRWEKSTDSGVTWTVPATGIGVPNASGVYVAPMVPASHIASTTDHMNQYRFTVASTPGNLNDPNCAFRDSARIIVLVSDCNVLSSGAVSLQGKAVNGHGSLKWIVENEKANTFYEIERSDDGRLFYRIGLVNGPATPGTRRTYSFVDPGTLSASTYYRIKIREANKDVYTKTILIGNISGSDIRSLVNPFSDRITFDIAASADMQAGIMLIDNYGKVIRQFKTKATKGLSPVSIGDLDKLSNGTYILRVNLADKVINKILVKMTRP